jgi:hypothetical protein
MIRSSKSGHKLRGYIRMSSSPATRQEKGRTEANFSEISEQVYQGSSNEGQETSKRKKDYNIRRHYQGQYGTYGRGEKIWNF